MLTLPNEIIDLFQPFEMLFHSKTWRKVQLLLIGAILAPGKRTVTSILRVMGLSEQSNFAIYHQVLNRARWSSLRLSQVLLSLLIRYLDNGDGPLVFGIDETIERRRGKRISAKGIYRDGVRSSKGHFVKASGLRWISLMWLTHISWAQRIWALPVLTALAPSERYFQKLGRPHKKLTDWARQMIIQLRRWLPHRYLVVVADSTYAALEFLHACQTMTNPVTIITRLRLDAALYEPAPPKDPHRIGRPPLKGKRLASPKDRLTDPQTEWATTTVDWYEGTHRTIQITSDTAVWYNSGNPIVFIRWVLIRDPFGEFEPQAFLSTDPKLDAVTIIQWFVMRWNLEVTFEEVRAHLGVETQRQWSDLAIARTTPVLLGLFSWVTLAAHALRIEGDIPVRRSSWYQKALPTFSDAIALVRQALWEASESFYVSSQTPEIVKIPRSFLDRLTNALYYAA
jgi:hypothetical protein